MGSYAQIAGQYVFLFVGAKSIGSDATSPWVLLIGIVWIVGLTYICYRGIELSARIQITLVVVEVALLVVMCGRCAGQGRVRIGAVRSSEPLVELV